MSPADSAFGELTDVTESEAVGETTDDGRRLHALVTQHIDFIWRALRRMGVCEADVADATQQVFLVAARKLAEIRPGSEQGFLFQVVLRIAANTRRRRARRHEVSDEALWAHEDQGPRPDDRAEERHCRVLLERILETMPEELRAVFVLSELEEITMAEIATIMGIPAGTVASRLRRARAIFDKQAIALHRREGRRQP